MPCKLDRFLRGDKFHIGRSSSQITLAITHATSYLLNSGEIVKRFPHDHFEMVSRPCGLSKSRIALAPHLPKPLVMCALSLSVGLVSSPLQSDDRRTPCAPGTKSSTTESSNQPCNSCIHVRDCSGTHLPTPPKARNQGETEPTQLRCAPSFFQHFGNFCVGSFLVAVNAAVVAAMDHFR
ncbi:hypothetical protein SHIRM173S_06868 [Streptomyces hirsutus]